MMKVNGDLKVDGSLYQGGSLYSAAGPLTTVMYDNKATGDQSTSGLSNTDINITGLTGKSPPGTPEAGDTYLVSANVGYEHDNQTQDIFVKIWVGTNGSTADTTPVMTSESQYKTAGHQALASSTFIVTLGSASDLIGLSIRLNGGSGQSDGIQGGTVLSSRHSFMEILKLS
jgi:hypothetical protein